MKHFRKRLLTLLALTLFGGAGAWAQQGPTNVTQFTTDLLPASWQDDYDHYVTLADLQDLGFEAVDVSVAQAWTGAPQGDYSWLIYGFNEGNCLVIPYDDSGDMGNPSPSSYTKGYLYGLVANGSKLFYTGSPEPAEIELTPNATGKVWTLGQTPDYDLELQVEYYQKYALKEIPEGWQILVNGQDSTNSIVEGSLNITETDAVTLIPAGNPRRVKSVTLEDEVLVNIDGVTLDITGCTTWAQIIARNPGKIIDDEGWVMSVVHGVLVLGDNVVETSHLYNPARQSDYHWEGI